MSDTALQTAFVGLGANLGDAAVSVREAADELAQVAGVEALRLSSLYRSAPVNSHGPDYVNAVAVLQTRLSPHQLLHALQAIEQRHGRERPYRNAPRTLDLDLLLVDALRIDTVDLTLPHPRMHQRAFVLAPLAELSPDAQIPGVGAVQDCLAACEGQAIERLP